MQRPPLWPFLLVFLLGAVVGFFAHSHELSKAQAAWKAEAQAARIEAAAALAAAAAADEVARGWEAKADSAAQAAVVAEAARAEQGRRRRSAEAALAEARTRADSAEAALALVPLLREAVDTADAAAAHWRAAYWAEQEAAAQLRGRGDSLARVVAHQDSIIARGITVVGSRRCRIPLLGVACPEVVLGYGVGVELEGGTVTAHRGPTVTAGWRLF